MREFRSRIAEGRIGPTAVLVASLVIGVVSAPLAGGGQQPHLPTIGFLGPPPSAGGLVQAFQQGLRDLGYEERRNIRIEYRYTDVALQGHPELFPRLAAELVGLRPDVLVVSVSEAALAAKAATNVIPIVMVSVADPVAAGIVASLGRPGGNVTGLTRETRDLIGKNLELLKESLPQTNRIGVLVNPADPLKSSMIADMKQAAKTLGVQLRFVESGPTQIAGAFSNLHSEGIGAVLVLGGGGFYLRREQISELALKTRLPSMFQNREFVEAGGLLSYAPNTVANYRRAAYFVDKILKGANPADLPIEQPTKFLLVINLKTAKAIGLAIPPSLLLQADQVIR